MSSSANHQDMERIFREWHDRARSRDVTGLLALYATDAVFESPLVMAILDDKQDGVLIGHDEIGQFFEEGTRRRPNALVRWHRTGHYLTDDQTLVWEYPRETPEGDQIDILELMEIEGGLIQKHRIYWGWKGCQQIAQALARPPERC
jgi:hypothetical protein